MLTGGSDKEWTEAKRKAGMSFTEGNDELNKKAEDSGKGRMSDGLYDQAGNFAGAAVTHGLDAITSSAKAAWETSAQKKLLDGEYEAPDMLGNQMDKVAAEMKKIMDRHASPKSEGDEDGEDAPFVVPEMVDHFGQGGPKSIADSLQSIGGGGNAAGLSIDEKILEEAKKQNIYLERIAEEDAEAHPLNEVGTDIVAPSVPETATKDAPPENKDLGYGFFPNGKAITKAEIDEANNEPVSGELFSDQKKPSRKTTASVGGVYGDAGSGVGNTTALLTSINDTVAGILRVLSKGGVGGGGNSGLVKVRG
jgi:hypothetical protein